MSWDGIYAENRDYPKFEVGDEIFTERSRNAITANNPYTVIGFHKKPGMTVDIWIVTILNDRGYEGEYASYHFKKTERQIREDKIKSILNEC